MSRLLRALAVGSIGGAAFAYLSMPLAWMLGAMVFTTIGSLSGLDLHVPQALRYAMISILGVLLGSSFTPDVLDQVARWPLTLAGLVLYLWLLTGVLFVYFRRVLGLDVPTAYFSATPGGLTEMVIAGTAMGADDRTIALIHASRVLLVVMVIPFWFRYMTGVVTDTSSVGPSVTAFPLDDALVLGACAIGGLQLGKLIRLPAYRLVGPMLASAAVHMSDLSHTAPPWQVVAAAQVVVGSAVGARFTGVALGRVLKLMTASVLSTATMLLMTVVFAFALARMTGIEWQPIVLAYSPGGLAEMSLIALSLGIEVAFVTTHHVARIGLIVIMAPLAFRLLGGSPPAEKD